MSRPRVSAGEDSAEKPGDGLSTVRAVDRAIAILRSFTPDAPAMSVLDIQKRVGLSRPTLYRLLQTLAGTGMIESQGDPQRFRLAPGVMQLAHTWLSGLDVVDVARPAIDRLREATGETAALFLLRGHERVCVLEQKSRHVLAISRGIGDTGPLTKGASGKAIIAFMTEAQRETAGVEGEKARGGLADMIAAVRRDGYAVSRGVVFVGAVALAAPVFDHFGVVIGSIGIFGPSARLNEGMVGELGAHLVEEACSLSCQLGYSPPQLRASDGHARAVEGLASPVASTKPGRRERR